LPFTRRKRLSARRRDVYIPLHRIAVTPTQEPTMKTHFAARAFALGLSAFFTIVMLGSVNYLATSEPSPGTVMAVASQPRA
jgi:hypothetical protein